jgi:hypothetical protein
MKRAASPVAARSSPAPIRHHPQLPPLQLAADVPVRRLAGAVERLPARPPHKLETLSDDTLYLPYATSLRMSDLGYQNDAQSGLSPHENCLDSYVAA